VDSNSDGVSQTGEIRSLASLNIAKINLQASGSAGIDQGNIVGLTSSYQTTDGATHAAADVWFMADKSNLAPIIPVTAVEPVDQAIAELGELDGSVASLPEQSAVGTPNVELTLQNSPPMIGEADTDLRTRVSSIASAMGTYETSTVGGVTSVALSGQMSTEAMPGSSTMLAVSGMADTMKKFDMGGGLLQKVDSVSTPTASGLNLNGIKDATGSGYLVSSVK
jgi:hypothetical protein